MPSTAAKPFASPRKAGCAVDCHFCLTAQLGLIRNLHPRGNPRANPAPLEQHKSKLAPQTNLVLMGQGEPLLNFDPVMPLCASSRPRGPRALPQARHVVTSGIVPASSASPRKKSAPSSPSPSTPPTTSSATP